MTARKIPSATAEDARALLDARERREGEWTLLDLMEMDRRFCAAVRRARPDLVRLAGGTGATRRIHPGMALPERRRRVGSGIPERRQKARQGHREGHR